MGRSRTMRRPIVRTIGHPPSAVPAVSAAPQASVAHTGAANVSISPPARSTSVITPMAFCESFAPWLKARAPAIATCATRTGPRRAASPGGSRAARESVGHEAGSEPDQRREREHGDHAQHAVGSQTAHASPVHAMRAALHDRDADKTPEQQRGRSSTGTRATT